MIFFVPAYDPATEANLMVATQIASEKSRRLLGGRATRKKLLAELSVSPAPLFAMSHGRPDRLLAQDGEMALNGADLDLLASRPVFAFACHTANLLGREASAAGSVWWGYTGTISSPGASEYVLPIFSSLFGFICAAFASADSPLSRGSFLLQIREGCRQASAEVDRLLLADLDVDAAPVLLCLLQIWQRLRVWEPGAPEPMRHPDAPPSMLL